MNALAPIAAFHAAELAPAEAAPDEPAALWSGKPRWTSAATRIWKVWWIAGYFTILLADGARLASVARAPADIWAGEARLLAISVVVTGSLLAMSAMTARTTRYTLDAHAVTFRYGVALPATLVIPLAAIEHVGVRLHRDGSGDVALRLKPGPGVIYPKLWPHARPWRLLRAEPMLRCIPDAGLAATRLCRALSTQGG